MRWKTKQIKQRSVDRLIGFGIEISHMHAENDAIKVELLLCYIWMAIRNQMGIHFVIDECLTVAAAGAVPRC